MHAQDSAELSLKNQDLLAFLHIVVLWIGCMLAAGLAFLGICGHLSTELLLAGEKWF
jgi:hypothetical protein